jgi:hypothetical protein
MYDEFSLPCSVTIDTNRHYMEESDPDLDEVEDDEESDEDDGEDSTE